MSGWKANRLRVLRAERRMTQRALALRLDVSQSTVSLWETAYVEPNDQEKRDLARVLRVPVEALTTRPEALAS